MAKQDYFLVQLPQHGTRYIGECIVCACPVVDKTLGSVFLCDAHSDTHCTWCGYTAQQHVGAFDVRRLAGGYPDSYTLPPGECPSFGHTICSDCMLPIGDSRVVIFSGGVVHYHDCCEGTDEMPAPYLRADSELMPELLRCDLECSDYSELVTAIARLPKPWRADTEWRTA
jgi:hypothetical protein